MISKAMMKLIHALEHKKTRLQEQLFVAEGPKVVGDLLKIASPSYVFATKEWMNQNQEQLSNSSNCQCFEITEKELHQASFLKHPQQVIALFPTLNTHDMLETGVPTRQLCLALDGIQDPGNLGTIIRIADWFGIEHIYCSEETADVYNPKVVQATMGSIARVKLCYTDLARLFASLPANYPIYGTLLDGHNIYNEELATEGIIVMGNEGKGISPAIRQWINHQLLIPNFPLGRNTAESLNVAIATAITCAEFRRRQT